MAMILERLTEGSPNLPETHYIDNRIYTDQGIFDDERPHLRACLELRVP